MRQFLHTATTFSRGPATNGNKPLLQRSVHSPFCVMDIPSDKVPDLESEVVTQLEDLLATGAHDQALQLLLDTLTQKDPAYYSLDFLDGSKLHLTTGNSNATLGQQTQEWLKQQLQQAEQAAPGTARDEDAMRKVVADLRIPPENLQIKISISDDAFRSVQALYSTVQHEFVHFQQLRAAPFHYIPDTAFPRGFINPSKSEDLAPLEVEAYLWEAEHRVGTGTSQSPTDMANNYVQMQRFYYQLDTENEKSWKGKVEPQLEGLWEESMKGLLGDAEAMIAGAGTKQLDEAQIDKLAQQVFWINPLWQDRSVRQAPVDNYESRIGAVKDYLAKIRDTKSLEPYNEALLAAKLELEAPKSSHYVYLAWQKLTKAYINLGTTSKAKIESHYKGFAPLLWEKLAEMLHLEIERLEALGDPWFACKGTLIRLGELLANTASCHVSRKLKDTYQAKHDVWLKKYPY